jgi:ATP-dependent Lon protease
VEEAVKGDGIIGLVASRDGSVEEPQPGQTYEVGTAAKIERVSKSSGNSLEVLVRGLERFRIEYWQATDPFLKAHVALAPDVVEQGVELDALVRSLQGVAKEVFSLSTELPKEVGIFLDQVKDPRYLVYLLAGSAGLGVEKGQACLEQSNLKDKLHTLISHFSQEKEILVLGKKIQTEAKEEMDKAQRDYFLRQQMKAIQKELGDTEETESVGEEYAEKIEKANLPEEAKKEAIRELKRLKGMSPQTPEHSVIKTYLDWILDLPWNTVSEDQTDIEGARKVLDEDHYDLEEVKDRIIEYLAVRKLLKERMGEPVKEKEL